MAKCSNSILFTHASIDLDDYTIVEERKDKLIETPIQAILREWAGKPDLTISIKQKSEFFHTDGKR